jgi:Prokaryotic membrane lipoprotein lipid attachment site
MQRLLSLISALALLSGCAAIPAQSPYLGCAGGVQYKVCERIKHCDDGSAVLVKDHIWDDRRSRIEDTPCRGG